MPRKKTFTIDRDTWYRGRGGSRLILDRSSPFPGHKCCLGFCLLSSGVEKESLLGVTTPSRVLNLEHVPPSLLWTSSDGEILRGDNDVTVDIILTNDNETLTEEKREKKLTTLFALVGFNVKFIGGDGVRST